MKSIINGFRYDTDKAIKIGSASYGYGGPMSRYGRAIGQNETSAGERIDPMTKEQALAWAEQYLDADEIEAGFADTIQDA